MTDARSRTDLPSGDRYVETIKADRHAYFAYSSSYACPLTPPENRLPVPILGGERLPAPQQ